MELDGISTTHPIGKTVQTNGNRRNGAQSLIVIKDIKERQNTRELEITLYGQEDTIFHVLGCITLSTISINFWSCALSHPS